MGNDTARFYDAVAAEFEQEYYGEFADGAIRLDVEKYEARLRALARRGDRALEIGSGTGHWLRLVGAATGGFVVGVDLSLVMCRQARAAGASVVVADASALPFRENVFDLVFSPYCALDHVPEYEQAFREIARVGTPHCRLSLMVDNSGRFIKSYWRVRHSNVQSLGTDLRDSSTWLHQVDGVPVGVFTKMYSPDELRALVDDPELKFTPLAVLTPLIPRVVRPLLARSRSARSLVRGVERLACQLFGQRSALTIVERRT